MITGLDDLLVSLGTDGGMIAAMAAAFALLRKSLRSMVDRDMGDVVAQKVAEVMTVNGETPRQVIASLRERGAAAVQAIEDLQREVDGLSRRLGELREDFIRHSERGNL